MKKISSLLLIAGIATGVHAQTTTHQAKGDAMFANYSFADAVATYTLADELTVDAYRRLAISYTNVGNTRKAEEAYRKFISTSGTPEDYFNYALVLKSNNMYGEADKWMKRFSEAKPDDLRSKDFVSNGGKVQEWLKDNGRYKVERLAVNTEQDDFGPAFYGNKIVFASSRDASPIVDRTYNWNDKPFLDIYMADNVNGELKKVKPLDGSVNNKWHEGPASFANGGATMAFTRNNYDKKSTDGVVKFEIFFRQFKDGKWINESAFKYNSPEYSTGHPSLSEDGNTMYFASDMPGGKGGSDIYRVVKNEKGEWSSPQNMGDLINTEGNEMFPFYEPKSAVLFFASNGLVGLGGLDVFMSPLQNEKFGKAVNMGASVNSAYDDFGLIIDGTLNKGFFSSNRTGGAGGDDLYSIMVLKPIEFVREVHVKGLVKNKIGAAISNATVVITDENGKVNTLQTDVQGAFAFTATDKQNFNVQASADKYNDAGKSISTAVPDDVVNVELTLEDKISVGMELSKVVNVNPIFFDLGKTEIRSDAALELDKIVKVMNENPTMEVELGSHTDCRGSASSNQKLSDARAKASAEYISQRISDPARIYGKGYGESKLINDCACEGSVKSDCPEDDHQQNRRTEFIVVKM